MQTIQQQSWIANLLYGEGSSKQVLSQLQLIAAVKFPVVSTVIFWNSAPSSLHNPYITTASVDKSHDDETAKSKPLLRTQWVNCLLMQPVSIEVQHNRSYADLEGAV